MAHQAPIALSMILCDSVIVDRATGKVTIFGAFENIQAPSFPARHPELTVFSELTDGHGETPITLKVVRLSDDQPDGEEIYAMTMGVTFTSPRQVVRLTLKIAPIDIPHEGEFRLILETDGAFIAERRLVAITQEPTDA